MVPEPISITLTVLKVGQALFRLARIIQDHRDPLSSSCGHRVISMIEQLDRHLAEYELIITSLGGAFHFRQKYGHASHDWLEANSRAVWDVVNEIDKFADEIFNRCLVWKLIRGDMTEVLNGLLGDTILAQTNLMCGLTFLHMLQVTQHTLDDENMHEKLG